MDQRIKNAFVIIKRNYQDKILLDTLAYKVGLSKYHLHRLFKAEFNETPAQCLLRTRLNLAKHYLKLKTQMSISELAMECGFSSLAVFSRAFSKQFGITPTKLLQQKVVMLNHYNTPLKVEVVNLPELKLCYEAVQLHSKALSLIFQKSFIKAKKLGLQNTSRKIGVLNHMSIHDGNSALNYYAGIEIKGKVSDGQKDDLLIIQAGKYASFTVTSEREAFINELVTFKYQWLDYSKYMLRELFALEEILDDSFHHRKIYIPIRIADELA